MTPRQTATRSRRSPAQRNRGAVVAACALVLDACLPLDDLDAHSSELGTEASAGEVDAAARDDPSSPESGLALPSSTPAESASNADEPVTAAATRDEGLGMPPVLAQGTADEGATDDSAGDDAPAVGGTADENVADEAAPVEGTADDSGPDEAPVDEGPADVPDPAPTLAACDAPGEFSGPFGGGCYWLSNEAVDWFDARARCAEWGGTLASVDSAQEDALLGAVAEENFWIGLNDREVEGRMVWDAGGFLRGFRDWSAGQPDDAGQNEDCVERDGDGFGWNDLPCTELRLFACER